MHDETTVMNGAKAAKAAFKKNNDETKMWEEIARAVLDSQPMIEPDVALAQAMRLAYETAVYQYPPQNGWMAALRLCVNDPRIRLVITDEEISKESYLCEHDELSFRYGAQWYRSELQKRTEALLFPPKVKPWSERITVEPANSMSTWKVQVDGLTIKGCCEMTEGLANALRLGLIAQKEQGRDCEHTEI